jgi:hypothetical protein
MHSVSEHEWWEPGKACALILYSICHAWAEPVMATAMVRKDCALHGFGKDVIQLLPTVMSSQDGVGTLPCAPVADARQTVTPVCILPVCMGYSSVRFALAIAQLTCAV